MHTLKQDLPVSAEMPEGIIRTVNWGEMTIEAGEMHKDMDLAPLFKGLPDDRCQCPHWGYVLKGEISYKFADHEEVYKAGEVYYVPPGHTFVLHAGGEYIEFSPTDQLSKTMEVVERNMMAQM